MTTDFILGWCDGERRWGSQHHPDAHNHWLLSESGEKNIQVQDNLSFYKITNDSM